MSTTPRNESESSRRFVITVETWIHAGDVAAVEKMVLKDESAPKRSKSRQSTEKLMTILGGGGARAV